MTDLKTYLETVIPVKAGEIRTHWRQLADFEVSVCINKERQASRYSQQIQASENGGNEIDTSPREGDPRDWVIPSFEQIEWAENLRKDILKPLQKPIFCCETCSLFLEPDWTVCPKCATKPAAKYLVDFARTYCSRCQRMASIDYVIPLDSSYCPRHGLEVTIGIQLPSAKQQTSD